MKQKCSNQRAGLHPLRAIVTVLLLFALVSLLLPAQAFALDKETTYRVKAETPDGDGDPLGVDHSYGNNGDIGQLFLSWSPIGSYFSFRFLISIYDNQSTVSTESNISRDNRYEEDLTPTSDAGSTALSRR